MRITILIAFSSLTFGLLGQSLSEARAYFENYEYARAANAYSSIAQLKKLPIDDYKRWAYSYYIIGENQKGLPISDSIIRMKEAEPMFFYINGEMNKGAGNYAKAKESYERYAKLDNEYDVSVKIASCEQIGTWTNQKYTSLSNPNALNDTKANIAMQWAADGYYITREIGKDSTGKDDVNHVDDSPLVLARPFFVSDANGQQAIQVIDKDPFISLSSVAFIENSNKAILSLTRPIGKSEFEKAPHIYLANYSKQNGILDSLKPWEFGGMFDTASCTHPTINASGNCLVFARQSEKTNGSDLYVSYLNGTSWSKPQAISSLNTSFDEMFPKFSGDTILFFSSDGYPGYGNLDLFKAKVEGKNFSFYEHPKAPVNSISDDFNFIWISADSAVFSSNRSGGYGDDDIYLITYEPKPVVVPEDSTDFEEFVTEWTDIIIYFDFDKYDLGAEEKKIADLIAFLEKYGESNIVIEGHTDRRGSDDYNMTLGLRRSNTVKEELVKRGLHPRQIETISKGETDPQVQCDKCTEEEHAKNRVAIVKLNAK